MKYLLIPLMMLSVLMTGCVTATETKVARVDRPVLVKIDPRLLEECPIPAPPDRDTYLASDISKRETMLTDNTIVLMKELDSCNKKIIGIKNTQQKMEAELSKPK